MNGISPTSWIFTQASDFLLGYGQPYASSYSYAYAGVLAAPQYIPTIYERTVYVNNYVYPSYAPRACYNWGPPVTYITKVTNIKNIDIDHNFKNHRMARLRNVMPPANLAHRHPAWREILPAEGATRQGHIRSVPDLRTAAKGLNRPDAIPAPVSLKRQPAEATTRNGGPGPGSTRPPINPALSTSPQQPPNRVAEPNGWRRPAGDNQATQSPEPVRTRGTDSSRLVITNTNTPGTGGRIPDPSLANPSAPTGTSAAEVRKPTPPLAPPQRQVQPYRGQQRDEQQVVQENQLRRQQDQRLQPEQQRAEQELRRRQQQRLEMERQQQQQARIRQEQQQQQARSQQRLQEEQQRRQADLQRQQQMQQQHQNATAASGRNATSATDATTASG